MCGVYTRGDKGEKTKLSATTEESTDETNTEPLDVAVWTYSLELEVDTNVTTKGEGTGWAGEGWGGECSIFVKDLWKYLTL